MTFELEGEVYVVWVQKITENECGSSLHVQVMFMYDSQHDLSSCGLSDQKLIDSTSPQQCFSSQSMSPT